MPNEFRERLIHHLGERSLAQLVQKLDEIQTVLPFIIERLEQIKKLREMEEKKSG